MSWIMKRERITRKCAEAGFSLVELIVATGILMLLMAGVFSQVAKMQSFSKREEKKRDMFQNLRESLDQMNRDIHAAGYPNVTQFNMTGSPAGSNPIAGFTSQTAVNSNLVASKGLVIALPNNIMLEGDVDGNGIIDSVAYLYCDPAAIVAPCTAAMMNGFKCPCLLRGEIPKANGVAPAAQTTLANMNVVLEALIPPGGTVETSIPPPVFLFYDAGGGVTTTLSTIKTVKVSIYAQAVSDTNSANEWGGRIRPQASMVLTAKINN